MSWTNTPSEISAAWAGIVPTEDGTGYRIVGYLPGGGGRVLPQMRSAKGSSAAEAYANLALATRREWSVGVREVDLLNLDHVHWTQMVNGIPKIKIVSEMLWVRAEPIWELADEDPPESLARSRALWLALTAAHDEEVRLPEEIPF